jgi:hypothetical protein
VAARWPDAALADEVAAQLAGLDAVIGLHFRKEEEVLLAVLDRALSARAAEALFSRMGEVARQHAGSA